MCRNNGACLRGARAFWGITYAYIPRLVLVVGNAHGGPIIRGKAHCM